LKWHTNFTKPNAQSAVLEHSKLISL
jgi:hypothetical protein